MQYKKRFPGRFESLGKISLFIKKAAEKAGLDENQAYAVELAVDEACSNIIEHSYGAENVGEINLMCVVHDDRLVVVLRDTGKSSFNPEAVPDVNTKLAPEDRNPGGAGIFLMRKVMDSVQYEFTKKENILTMIKFK